MRQRKKQNLRTKINPLVSGVFLCLLLGWTHAVAAPPAGVDASIREIRRHYKEVNRLAPKYRQVSKELIGFSTEGGKLVAYFDGDDLMKIAIVFYGESGESTEEFYYWNNQLAFVFRTDSSYDHLLSGHIVQTVEDRFYFSHDTLIGWIDEDAKQADPSSEEAQKKQKECLQSSADFIRAAHSKEPVIEAPR